MKEIVALNWLNQPGIKAVLFNHDRDTNEALKVAINALQKSVEAQRIQFLVEQLPGDYTYNREDTEHVYFRNGKGEILKIEKRYLPEEKDIYEFMVVTDEVGTYQGTYVSPELRHTKIEFVNLATADDKEAEKAREKLQEARRRTNDGKLVHIY